MAAKSITTTTPPAVPPAMLLMCNLGDGTAFVTAVFEIGEEVVKMVMVVGGAVVFGADGLNKSKHDTSGPFFTKKSDE